MNSTLAEEVKRDNKDSSRLSTIQGFLENCYKLSSLQAAYERLSAVCKLHEQASLHLEQARSHCEQAAEIIEDDGDKTLFLGEIERCHLSIQYYREIKTKEFSLLKNIVEEFWNDLPHQVQETFELWAKDLAIRVEQQAQTELERQSNLVLQELLEGIPDHWGVTTEEVVERLRQLAQNKDYENPIKAELGFIASVFRQETEHEDSFEEPVANIYLKGGETIQMPLSQADTYMVANRDKLEYRTHKPRRVRN